MTMTMEMITAGIDRAPHVGTGGKFFSQMFVESQGAWDHALEEARSFTNAAPGRGPIGSVRAVKKDGYEYLYYVDAYGGWQSVAFRMQKGE